MDGGGGEVTERREVWRGVAVAERREMRRGGGEEGRGCCGTAMFWHACTSCVMRHASYHVVMCSIPTAADIIFALRMIGDVLSARGITTFRIASLFPGLVLKGCPIPPILTACVFV